MTLEEQISQLDLSTYPIQDVERIISDIGSIGLEVYPVQKGSTMHRVYRRSTKNDGIVCWVIAINMVIMIET